jgi:monoterpene epsilon-lactone hydrolase
LDTEIHFVGPAGYRIRSMAQFSRSVLKASVRRALKGPRRAGWNWFMEIATGVLKERMMAVCETGDVVEARRYLDSVLITSPEMAEVDITQVVQEKFRGSWFTCKHGDRVATVLYFHGGGYSFYPKTYANFIALLTVAMKCRTFALDYSLTPEHRFPTQLEEALHAYRWLLESGTEPDALVLAGDSAGANLALAVLLAARDLRLPLPALAVAISPPTEIDPESPSMLRNADSDWISQSMLLRWADWFCDADQRRNPLVSPLRADLHDLPLIYLQAGRAEILYDSIQAFADRAQSERRDVILESWEDMNHDFQIFGRYVPQSVEALRRLADVVDTRVRKRKNEKLLRVDREEKDRTRHAPTT